LPGTDISNKFTMEKKTIFITGSSSGIGKATAQLFSQKGWNVIATQRNPEKDTDLGKLPGVVLMKLDVTDELSVQQCVKEAYARFATIDVLLNNAGYGSLGVFEAATTDQIKRQIDTNVLGLMCVTRAFIPHFRQQRSGAIINVASLAGNIGFPLFSIYNCSKFAVEGFSEGLHYELAQFGVKVRIIEPGPIKTDFYSRSMDFINSESLGDYQQMSKNATKVMVDFGMKSKGPEVVAKTIYKAASCRGNRLRYPVGGGAGPMLLLKKLLPGCLMRRVVGKVFGL